MTKLFRDFRIADEAQFFRGSVLVRNGRIESVTEGAVRDADTVFSGGGRLVLMPAFVEAHAHLRDPGFPAKETLESGIASALRGGYCASVCMANTDPVIDNESLAGLLHERARALGFDIFPCVSLTEGMRGEALSPFLLSPSGRVSEDRGGVRLLSEDGRDVADTELFRAALRRAAEIKLPVSCHCDIGGEAEAVARAVELGAAAGARLHIAHVSLGASCAVIAAAKKNYPGLSCEASPHHIALSGGAYGNVAPPLRNEDDRRAVIAALRDGVIDMTATDHAPHAAADKEAGAPGFIGFETAFPVLNTTLVRENGFSFSDISRLLSAAPAKLLGLSDRGRIKKGLRADFAIVDPDAQARIEPPFASRSANSPFIGANLHGRVVMTVIQGAIRHETI